jgi:hypothetical protein
MDQTHYQQYLKARGQYPDMLKAADAWRCVQYDLAQTAKRRLSPTYAEVERIVDGSTDVQHYCIAGVSFKLDIGMYQNDDAFEGFGKVYSKSGYLEGHDRNDEYWVLRYDPRSTLLLTPEYTRANRYSDYCAMKYGKARANDAATKYRQSDIKWAEKCYEHGEYERYVTLIIEGDDDGENVEWFSPDDLTSIYDWVASKLDSYVSQQRQAA